MKLKQYGYILAAAATAATILAAATILSKPALAIPEVINPLQPEERTPHEPEDPKPDHWVLVCRPDAKLDKNERDPTFRVHVTADFAKEWSLVNLTVQFETYKGIWHDRGKQYEPFGYYGRVETKYAWMWNGKKKEVPKEVEYHVLSGGLYVTEGDHDKYTWHYTEVHEVKYHGIKKAKLTEFSTTCDEVSDKGVASK